jgi:hypothetical protein
MKVPLSATGRSGAVKAGGRRLPAARMRQPPRGGAVVPWSDSPVAGPQAAEPVTATGSLSRSSSTSTRLFSE